MNTSTKFREWAFYSVAQHCGILPADLGTITNTSDFKNKFKTYFLS